MPIGEERAARVLLRLALCIYSCAMERRPTARHVQDGDGYGAAVTTVHRNPTAESPQRDTVLLSGRGSPTPAVSVAHYGVIDIDESDALGSSSSHRNGAAGDGAASSGVSGDTPSWYNGPWGALLCDMICFGDDFARKTEALFWDSINAESQ